MMWGHICSQTTVITQLWFTSALVLTLRLRPALMHACLCLRVAEDLLLWTDIPKSAGVLAAATLLYILLEWSGVPLLTWLSNLALITIAGTSLWAVGARVANV